ncbi:MAG: hypothetical protein MPW15_17645 [Candidatus Manganitrophus sp.]|nr:hypothetical protein [Candidatus Manganitrophus sp.]
MLKLIQKKMDLANLQTEYKETYPDIIMLKREIQELEDQVALTEMSGGGNAPGGIERAGPKQPERSKKSAVEGADGL